MEHIIAYGLVFTAILHCAVMAYERRRVNQWAIALLAVGLLELTVAIEGQANSLLTAWCLIITAHCVLILWDLRNLRNGLRADAKASLLMLFPTAAVAMWALTEVSVHTHDRAMASGVFALVLCQIPPIANVLTLRQQRQ